MRNPGGRALPVAAMALLALAAVGPAVAGGGSGQRERARDGRLAYTVGIDRGDCGKVLDCVDTRVRVAEVRRARGRRRALTIGGCPSRDCDDGAPAWSPDGRTLIFNRIQDTGGMSIATGARGGRQREVRGGTEPAFSPSGRRIAYEAPVKTRRFGRFDQELFVGSLELDGRERRRTFRGGFDASWSSRGRIAFSRPRGNNGPYEVFTIHPDRGREKRLTRRGGQDPDWSPDGRRLAFLRGFVRGEFQVDDVLVIGARGGRVRRLTRGGAQSPTWSPSGREIAFTRGRRVLAVDVRTRKVRELARVRRHRTIDAIDWQPLPRR